MESLPSRNRYICTGVSIRNFDLKPVKAFVIGQLVKFNLICIDMICIAFANNFTANHTICASREEEEIEMTQPFSISDNFQIHEPLHHQLLQPFEM